MTTHLGGPTGVDSNRVEQLNVRPESIPHGGTNAYEVPHMGGPTGMDLNRVKQLDSRQGSISHGGD